MLCYIETCVISMKIYITNLSNAGLLQVQAMTFAVLSSVVVPLNTLAPDHGMLSGYQHNNIYPEFRPNFVNRFSAY